MFRGLFGYMIGAVAGFSTCMFLINSDFISAIGINAISIPIVLVVCHKHHIKKRNEYYDKIHGKS